MHADKSRIRGHSSRSRLHDCRRAAEHAVGSADDHAGVAAAPSICKGGAMYVTSDASGSIWRASYGGK
jgi:hypothetical protein